MDYFGKNKLLLGVIALLIVINLATLGTLWWLTRQDGGSRPSGISPKDFIIKELQLSDAQQQQFEQLVSSHQRASREILEQMGNAKKEFFALVQRPSVSDSLTSAKATEIGRLESMLDLVTLRHFQEVKNICDEQQRAKFNGMMEQVLQQLASTPLPPDRRGGPSPGTDGPPPDEGSEGGRNDGAK